MQIFSVIATHSTFSALAVHQAQEGSYQSLQITMLQHYTIAGHGGRFLCYPFSQHRVLRKGLKRALGMGRIFATFGISPAVVAADEGSAWSGGNEL